MRLRTFGRIKMKFRYCVFFCKKKNIYKAGLTSQHEDDYCVDVSTLLQAIDLSVQYNKQDSLGQWETYGERKLGCSHV